MVRERPLESVDKHEEESGQLPWWAAVLLVILAFGGMLASLAGAALLVQVAQDVSYGAAFNRVQGALANVGMAQALGFSVAIVVGARMFAPGLALRDALLVHPVSYRKLAFAFVAGLALQFPLAELGNLASMLWPVPLAQQLRMQHMVSPETWGDGLIAFATIVVVAPVSEELLFRGLLFRGLVTKYSPAVAVGLSAVLFGVSHGLPAAIAFSAVAGLLFAGVALRTGSVAPTLAMHMAVNATPLLLPRALVPIPGFNLVSEQVQHVPLPLLATAAIVACMAVAMLLSRESNEA